MEKVAKSTAELEVREGEDERQPVIQVSADVCDESLPDFVNFTSLRRSAFELKKVERITWTYRFDSGTLSKIEVLVLLIFKCSLPDTIQIKLVEQPLLLSIRSFLPAKIDDVRWPYDVICLSSSCSPGLVPAQERVAVHLEARAQQRGRRARRRGGRQRRERDL